MKNDLISRQMAIDAVHEEFDDCLVWDESGKRTADEFETIINRLPAVQPKRKRGKWEMLQMPISPPVYKCSVCGSHALQSMTGCLMNRHYEACLTNYCPNCGAEMKGENS
jgi:hypothetical protein